MDRLISLNAVLSAIGEWIAHREYDYTNATEYLRNRIKAIPSADKWIPVSERLPEENVEVLVTTEWGSITIAERYSANDYFINDGATNADEDEIIAWMPLPKPYEPQESEKINCKSTKCDNCINHNYCDYEPQERGNKE